MASPKSSGRMIRRAVAESEKIPLLSPEAAVLFFMLIPHYSSHGKMKAGPGHIKDEVCPFIPYLTYDNISQYLQEISDKTSVKWFRHGGHWWLHSLHFLTEHQDLRTDRLGRDDLPSYVPPEAPDLTGTSPGVAPDLNGTRVGQASDLPSRAEVRKKEEEKKEKPSPPALEKELPPPPTPAAASPAGGQAVPEAAMSESERRLRASAHRIRGELEAKFTGLDFEIEVGELCAKYRHQTIGADPELLVRRWFRTAVTARQTRGSPGNNEAFRVIQANLQVVRGFAGNDGVRLRFGMVFSWLAEKYPLKAVPRLLTVTFLLDYHEALADEDIEDVEDGARWHYRQSRFFPQVPATLRESIQAAISRKARISMATDVGKPQDEPDDPEELRRYYQDTLDGMQRMGLNMTGWYIDDSGERPRLVTGRSDEG